MHGVMSSVVRGIVLFMVTMTPVAAGQLVVSEVSPSGQHLTAARDASVSVTFDLAIDPATVTDASFWAFGKWSGAATGTFEFSNGDTTVTLVPDEPFTAGESVMVILANTITAADGSPMRAGGYSWMFWTETAPSPLVFNNIDTFSTRTSPSVPTVSYGGVGSDMNNDGHLDLSVINEDTADLRVYLNLGDGTGLLGDMVDPPAPLDVFASPNEPSDFNRDGNTDLCVCASAGDTLTVLLGAGDGTFPSVQQISVGNGPRGNAVLDLDGDGDIDIVNANRFSQDVGIFINDGTGTFSTPTMIPMGHDVFAMCAADMDEDGLIDVVVGSKNSGLIQVLFNNGDGTLGLGPEQFTGEDYWVMVSGDVNGDGHADIATSNSQTNTGSIFFGDGIGGLSASTEYGADGFPLSSDLGDLDGDGDLDWILSNYSGDWQLFLNDGAGNFTFDREFPAPDAASCAVMMDLNNDHVLDLALIDELDDLVILQLQQLPEFIRGDGDDDGGHTIGDAIAALDALFQSVPVLCEDALDSNDDGALDIADPIALLSYLFVSGPDLPAPFLACGGDPSGDALSCETYGFCP